MVALAIASIALVSFITLVLKSIDVEEHARKVTEATLIAEEKLKEIERGGFPEIGTTDGPIENSDTPGYSYRIVVSATPIDQVRQVDLDILWENKKRSITLTAFIAKQ
jgi:general secretion pathway protein I